MLSLPASYWAVAPDQRGYGLSASDARIDATRGVADWVDDVIALANALGWDRYHVVGHSLGGCVTWGLLGREASRILTVTLVAPGPPCGFGGARDRVGSLNHEDGAGSGAGLVHGPLVERLAAGEREITSDTLSPRAVMNRLYWKPPFRPQREEQLLTAMLQVHLGPQEFPGDVRTSSHWPGFAPGIYGPINAISPLYNQWVLPQLIEALAKPPLLWIYGEDDLVVRDGSLSDAGTQGRMGIRRGWPGESVFPPQPLLTQVTYALTAYEQQGGHVQRFRLPGVGHTPYLERPAAFQSLLINHLERAP